MYASLSAVSADEETFTVNNRYGRINIHFGSQNGAYLAMTRDEAHNLIDGIIDALATPVESKPTEQVELECD